VVCSLGITCGIYIYAVFYASNMSESIYYAIWMIYMAVQSLSYNFINILPPGKVEGKKKKRERVSKLNC
jgi:hypothetical protein